MVDELSPDDLRTATGRRMRASGARWLFASAAGLTVLVSVLILWTIGREAWGFVSKVEFDQLFSIGWFPRRGLFDVGTLLVNTRIAHWFPLEIFHLLGFRKQRADGRTLVVSRRVFDR